MIKFKSYPIANMDLSKINSPFGARRHPITKKLALHEGIDYPEKSGVPVLAVADGRVFVSKMQSNGKGYGNYVVIRHNGFDTLYAHLSKRTVAVNQIVKAGQIIGNVGTTGSSTGNHLHFGLCKDFLRRDFFDPLPYLKDIGDDEVIDKIKVIKDGKEIEVERILKNDTNYIRLRDFEDKLGLCEVGYDSTKKMPIIKTR